MGYKVHVELKFREQEFIWQMLSGKIIIYLYVYFFFQEQR